MADVVLPGREGKTRQDAESFHGVVEGVCLHAGGDCAVRRGIDHEQIHERRAQFFSFQTEIQNIEAGRIAAQGLLAGIQRADERDVRAVFPENREASTNLSMKQLREIYSERTSSRIFSNYQPCKLFGDDIRIKKKLSNKS